MEQFLPSAHEPKVCATIYICMWPCHQVFILYH